jgi:hypothetical protein
LPGRQGGSKRDVTGKQLFYANSSYQRGECDRTAAVFNSWLAVLWRLRRAEAEDNKEARLLEHRPSKSAEWSAERLEADTRIREGERVRVSIESPSTGYLYVIDREQ